VFIRRDDFYSDAKKQPKFEAERFLRELVKLKGFLLALSGLQFAHQAVHQCPGSKFELHVSITLISVLLLASNFVHFTSMTVR